jgi:predicted  nucleic acid-binding Zn-ribbon protein
MYSAEVLSQLRSLNWLAQEIRRVPPASRERALLQSQMDAVRSRLPDSLLDHHDRLSAGGKLTAAEVNGDICGGCGAKLPQALVITLGQPGRFGVCPRCDVFLWSAKSADRREAVATKRTATKASHD